MALGCSSNRVAGEVDEIGRAETDTELNLVHNSVW